MAKKSALKLGKKDSSASSNSQLFSWNKKGLAQVLSVVIIGVGVALYFLFSHLLPNLQSEEVSLAAPPTRDTSGVVLEGESFSTYSLSGGLQVMDDSTASGGQGMMFSINTTSQAQVMLNQPTTKIVISAKASRCHGGPTMVVKINDTEVMRKKVPSVDWNSYQTNYNLAPGSYSISVTFADDYTSTSGQGCDRILYLDRLTFI